MRSRSTCGNDLRRLPWTSPPRSEPTIGNCPNGRGHGTGTVPGHGATTVTATATWRRPTTCRGSGEAGSHGGPGTASGGHGDEAPRAATGTRPRATADTPPTHASVRAPADPAFATAPTRPPPHAVTTVRRRRRPTMAPTTPRRQAPTEPPTTPPTTPRPRRPRRRRPPPPTRPPPPPRPPHDSACTTPPTRPPTHPADDGASHHRTADQAPDQDSAGPRLPPTTTLRSPSADDRAACPVRGRGPGRRPRPPAAR